VPPELMAGVDVYKNPSAEQIEGAIGGLVNQRTALPFDHKGWNTDLGEIGALVDVAQVGDRHAQRRPVGVALLPAPQCGGGRCPSPGQRRWPG
jgi:hypothetical protein